ncbi:hypothetical protein EVAR_4903_1 [Eumeta japonica]|uniref:Uncharacterized protein n=1 Tax=Eumeta variegata TaxID=151549 RepID=A0A4C1Y007_EUMVA|nr:hypothetical protein EVAR_4903_1 [Eumeta japonica]
MTIAKSSVRLVLGVELFFVGVHQFYQRCDLLIATPTCRFSFTVSVPLSPRPPQFRGRGGRAAAGRLCLLSSQS